VIQELDIGSTDPNIPIDNTCTNDKLHFRMLWARTNNIVDGKEKDQSDAIPVANWQ
jgi:hypothetical protein